MKVPPELAPRIVVVASGCWQWVGYVTPSGYGQVGRNTPAHRYVYELLIGPVPPGMHLDHLCHNNDESCPGGRLCLHRRCVNPDDVEPVLPGENVKRSRVVGRHANHRALRGVQHPLGARDHCANGHLYSPQNTYWRPDGGRTCRACNREARRRYVDRMIDVQEVTA